MSRNTIRVLVVLALVSIGGIIVTQVYWFRRAFDAEAQQFNRDVNTALFNVASQFFEINKAAIPSNNPIKQLSTNYYVVMINNEIDANLLEFLLTSEFEKRNISADFEYGIYDCTNDKMVYGSYVSMNSSEQEATTTSLPKWEDQNYYFGVQFPHKARLITSRMEVWIFSSAVLVIVLIFFAYSLFVILKQKRLSEIQKDFINNMTHEFKTPISTISLSAEVLKGSDIINQPDRLHSYATIIENENLRLKNQVERVLQMASLEREEISLNKEQTSLHQLLTETIEGFNLTHSEVDINTALKATHDQVIVDRLHMRNVINNLLDNAIKYCRRVPQIKISTYNLDNNIFIDVKDNGIGISKDHQKKIFNKFYRVPTGNVHDVKGFGLGLNYVNIIMKAHKGSVELIDSNNAGSTLKLTLKNA
ncbi:MAG: HAMP domain-containing sensor histidine kinase [Fulvivirga sp.]